MVKAPIFTEKQQEQSGPLPLNTEVGQEWAGCLTWHQMFEQMLLEILKRYSQHNKYAEFT